MLDELGAHVYLLAAFCAVALFCASVGNLRAAVPAGPPDEKAIMKEAAESSSRMLFDEDFEGRDRSRFVRFPAHDHWMASRVPYTVTLSEPTAEQAFSGKRSYKIQFQFEQPRVHWGGKGAVRLPIDIPRWSDVKVTMRVKADAPKGTQFLHGFVTGRTGIENMFGEIHGKKIGDENGWEVWEAVAGKYDLQEYVRGPAIIFQLPENTPATTVTIYVDKITIESKLPADWADKWARVYRAGTDCDSRLAAAIKRRSEIRSRLRGVSLPDDADPALKVQFEAVMGQIKSGLKTVDGMLADMKRLTANTGKPFGLDINEPERALGDLGYMVDVARAYPAYARQRSSSDVLQFALEPTFSYEILPTGPMAHNSELRYFEWSETGLNIENPQVLPDALPVPAMPSRSLKGYGCRGIYVPFSFAVKTGRRLSDLTLSVSDLKSKDGMIPASAADVRIVAPWFRPCALQPRLMNELLVHDPSLVIPLENEQKNALKNVKYIDDAPVLLPVTIPAGKTRQFYMTVKIPDGRPAGTYKGKVTAKAADGTSFAWNVALEVLPFDLEQTPYAYSAFYRGQIRDEALVKEQGTQSWNRTAAQMENDLIDMGEHGFNTLNTYDGKMTKTDAGWDFSRLDMVLSMAKRAGLTRSPFTWLGHPLNFYPDQRPGYPKTMDEVIATVNDLVPRVNKFCDEKGYPRPGIYGVDERSGEELTRLKQVYEAINKAGGIVTVACYPSFFDEVGSAIKLPIVYGGTRTPGGLANIRAAQAAGSECWIYNCPATNLTATPSVYRRRYGLAMWKNGEQGAAPWEFGGVPVDATQKAYLFDYNQEYVISYTFAYPTWSGKPLPTVIYEAYREGIYDTRYMATLQKYLAEARTKNTAPKLVAQVDSWLANFSVHDDLGKVRRQMVEWTRKLRATGSR